MNNERPVPYITAALLCENVIDAKDGSLSAIRIADRVEWAIVGPPGETPPEGSKPVVQLKGLLALKSGPVRGNFVVKIKVVRPTGKEKKDIVEIPMTLNGGDHGFNAIINLALTVEEEGLHWFDVYFGNELLTRIPLMVVQRQPATVAKQ